jgi:hypothetical protein
MYYRKSVLISIVILLMLSTSIFSAEQIRPEIKAIVNKLEEKNMLYGPAVGYGGVKDEQWTNFEELLKNAGTDELIILTKHKNPVIRCYAFWGLVEKRDKGCYQILLNHLTDSESVTTFFGCVISGQMVGDVFLQLMNPAFYDEDVNKLTTLQHDILTQAERDNIASELLLKPHVELAAKSVLLETIKPDEKYYDRIKEIVVKEKIPQAFIALAKFKKVDDLPLLIIPFETEETEIYAIKAVIAFPDKRFYPYLTKIFYREWQKELYDYQRWRVLYQALARFPNSTTMQMFDMTVKTRDSFRYQTLGTYMLIAITKYPNELYDKYSKELKLDKSHAEEVKSWLDSK